MKTRYIRYVCALAPSALYVASLFEPAFKCPAASYDGLTVLLVGWLSVIFLDPRWLANIAFFKVIHWLARKTPSDTPIFSLIFISLCACASLAFSSPIGCPDIGTMQSTKGLAIGGYLWVAAMFAATVSSIIATRFAAPKSEEILDSVGI